MVYGIIGMFLCRNSVSSLCTLKRKKNQKKSKKPLKRKKLKKPIPPKTIVFSSHDYSAKCGVARRLSIHPSVCNVRCIKSAYAGRRYCCVTMLRK